jgi:hypothetical protein
VHFKTAPARFSVSSGVSIDIGSSTDGNGGDIVIVAGTAAAATPGTLRLAIGDWGRAAGGETHIASSSGETADGSVFGSANTGLRCCILEVGHNEVLTGGLSLIVIRPVTAVTASWQMSGIRLLVS